MKRLIYVVSCCCIVAIAVCGTALAGPKGKGHNDNGNGHKTCLCHIPPGNPDNAHTICIGNAAVPAHLAHGDTLGACSADTSCEPVACGGTTGTTCPPGQFCMRTDGTCSADAEGQCTATPVDCPILSAPTCGCDGVTYFNACFAQTAGVSVAHAGACTPGVACGGQSGVTCPTGEFCQPPMGECTAGAAGNCAPILAAPICSTTVSQVCGCNGTTYDNACLAQAAGVAVDHTSACAANVVVCGGAAPACPAGQFCNRPPGSGCDPGIQGVCETTPTSCPGTTDPVCGCNGTTYVNACLANVAGVAISVPGTCETPHACGGQTGGTCEGNEFCKIAAGNCGSATVSGTCVLKPPSCPTTSAPVCGCDAMTYNNACLADAAGVSISHTGACP